MIMRNITVLGQEATSPFSPGCNDVYELYSCAWATHTVHSAPREENEGVNITFLGKENKTSTKKKNLSASKSSFMYVWGVYWGEDDAASSVISIGAFERWASPTGLLWSAPSLPASTSWSLPGTSCSPLLRRSQRSLQNAPVKSRHTKKKPLILRKRKADAIH